jgi:hypothetical protein
MSCAHPSLILKSMSCAHPSLILKSMSCAHPSLILKSMSCAHPSLILKSMSCAHQSLKRWSQALWLTHMPTKPVFWLNANSNARMPIEGLRNAKQKSWGQDTTKENHNCNVEKRDMKPLCSYNIRRKRKVSQALLRVVEWSTRNCTSEWQRRIIINIQWREKSFDENCAWGSSSKGRTRRRFLIACHLSAYRDQGKLWRSWTSSRPREMAVSDLYARSK